MNKVVLLILTGAVAVLLEGCSFFSNFADSKRNLERDAGKPNPAKLNNTATKTQEIETESEEFADLEDEAQPVQSIAGLIPATNPETRVRSSVRGRQDPFSTVTLTPRIEIETQEDVEQSSSNNNRNFNRFNNEANNKGNATTGTASAKSNSSGNINRENSSSTAANSLDPTLAQQVVISGLYEAGGRTRLIIQAPEEHSSRYVEVGQYLSNGKVLVKSIDRNHLPTPKVILEQAGVEFSRTIGENPEDIFQQQS